MAKQAIMQRNIPLAKKYLARIRPSSYYYGKALYEIAKKDRYSKRYSYIIALGRLGHTRFQSKLALSMLKSKFRYALRLRGSRRYKKFREMEYLAQYIRHRDYIGEKYWYLGLKEYLSDDPETAARYFVKSAKALERSRSSDKDPSKAYYWLFVTYKSLDKDLAKYYLYKAASFDNPESFYALRAKKLINVKKTLLDVKQPLPRVKLSKADKKLFLIVRLKHIGAYVDAYREARYHFNKADRLPHKLALLEKFKLHKVFPEITARSFYRKYKENKKVYKSYLGYSYPKPFEYITKEDLVYAIMRQESFFNTYAVSRAGARGLMQIMPRTGRWISRRLGVRNFKVSDLFIPEVNIRFGRFYIHYLLRKYRGNLIYAIAAYNAGYGNVNKFLKRYSITDPAEFVEFFPLSETRDYVKKVYINYIFYSE
jgi:soluble lytic murein transglycosylase